MEPLVVISVIPDIANTPDTFMFLPPPVMRACLKPNNALHFILRSLLLMLFSLSGRREGFEPSWALPRSVTLLVVQPVRRNRTVPERATFACLSPSRIKFSNNQIQPIPLRCKADLQCWPCDTLRYPRFPISSQREVSSALPRTAPHHDSHPQTVLPLSRSMRGFF